MKIILFTAILTAVFSNAMCQAANEFHSIINDNWLSNAQDALKQSEYNFKQVNHSNSQYYVGNQKQGIGFILTEKGYHVTPVQRSEKIEKVNEWEAGLTFLAIRKGDHQLSAEHAVSVSQKAGELNFHYPDFTIAYHNNSAGMRQNFIVSKKLQGKNNLEIVLSVESNLTASVISNAVNFKDKSGTTRLFYKDLKVWDANQHELAAAMEMRNNNTIVLVVKDQEAAYPITIDPISQTPEWTTSAGGILPSLVGQLAVDAAYGFSVVGLGDVNSDGFDDVAIGAPAMVVLISGTGTLASVGAVFVYYGSANGLPVLPSAKLQPTTAVAGALFGFSIAGGDINNDGKSDIIVGAPLDNVTISTGGSSTAISKVGKAYVFDGAALSTNTTPFLTLQLSGNGILENGINLSLNALFGFSVAVTDDLNGDGKNDLLVGAPAYAGITTGLLGVHLLDVKSGGAFIFLTNAANNNLTILKLQPIKTSLLGLGLLANNINGLLFGYSVDGIGDYNGDGKPDIVVGSPAGVDLGSVSALLNGKLLQGSATVYYGTGAGVDVNPGVSLTATSGGLLTNLVGSVGNVANLFGYSVKGAKDASGLRNGSVLAGAPLGGALTNILGLQLKTGTVNVFKNRTTSPSGYVAPDQVLSSPRNDNTILGLIQTNLLFGFSIDNALDINCDGIGDIIVGEPAASGIQLINANIAGGAAYVYLGKTDGTYEAVPCWSLDGYVDAFLGINATSLIGYSVAGAGKLKGASNRNFLLAGSPSRSLDFGAGLLNLGNTLSTLFSLTAGNNGVGKAWAFDANLCMITLHSSLSELRGSYRQGVSILNWQTVQEINTERFEIEKSEGGYSYHYIGQVPGKGYSNSESPYQFNDRNFSGRNTYYRLKVIDKNGGFFYSNTVFMRSNDITVMVGPNPFKEKLLVKINASSNCTARITIFNAAGKVVLSQQPCLRQGSNEVGVNGLAAFAAGMYTIETAVNGNTSIQQIIK